MFSHIMIGTNDLARANTFYDAVLGTLGVPADAWHAAGLAHGGSTCEDPPGVRDGSTGKLYLAYLRDPDGNKLCCMHRLPRA